MCTYLQPHHGSYYFRRAIPAEIRHLFPTVSGKSRTQWRWSLRVKNREDAKRLLPPLVAKTNAWVDQAKAAIASAKLEVGLAPTDEQLAASHKIANQIELDGLESAEFFARKYAEEEGRAEVDPDFALILDLRAAKGRELRRLQVAEEGQELAAQLRSERRVSLLGLFEQYAAMPGRHAKTVAQWRPYIARLVEFIGEDNALTVSHRNLVEWRNHLRDVAKYRGKPLSPKTVNDSYLGAASALFAWAKGDGIIDRNPMLEVSKVSMPKTPQLRNKEFGKEEALTILRATLQPSTDRTGADWKNAKRWCPWLMAYSGARVNEITQLRKQDVQCIEGVQVMRLTPEAGTIKAKQARVVPLHRDLIDQGFLAFVEARPEGPLFYDPALRRSDNAINRQANRLGSKLAQWVRELDIAGVKPNHGWRHLFNTLAVRHGLDHRATMAILGHASGNVNQSYGSVQVDVMARELAKLPPFETGT